MFDFIRFCTDYSIEYWTEGKNVTRGWVNVRCPFCNDKSNHLGFNLASGKLTCWHDGGHYIAGYLKRIGINDIHNVLKKYDTAYPIHLSLNEDKVQPTKIKLPGNKLEDIHKKYLLKRNFNPLELEDKYKLLGTTHLGDYKFRIIIPIVYNNQVVSFTSRDITGIQDLKYKTLQPEYEIIHHKHILYNLDNCRKDRCLVVEGSFDTMNVGDNCCSTFGIAWTKEQALLLSKRFKTVFLLFDPEPKAQEKAESLSYELSSLGVNSFVVSHDLTTDPGDTSKEDIIFLKKELNLL